MKKLLVTGISGFLGWHISQVQQSKWQIIGTAYQHPISIPNGLVEQLDLTDPTALERLFQKTRPDAVIHTAAQGNANYCEEHQEVSYPINVTVPKKIAQYCADRQIPCLFTSTDLIFDGDQAPYKETDEPKPVSVYGRQKVKAEQAMQAAYKNVTICRMPLMFGEPSPHSNTFLQGFLEKMQQGEPLKLFTDEFRTPVSGSTAAKGLFLVLDKGVSGKIHLGGKERLSRYAFGKIMTKVFQLPDADIQPGQQADVPMPAPRPRDVSLDSSKAFKLGYSPPSVREALKQIKNN